MRWDGWEIFGLLGEALFFARLIVQWLASEEAGRPVLPVTYWYFSLAGSLILAAYAWHLGSVAFLAPNLVGLGIYARQLQLEWRQAVSSPPGGCQTPAGGYNVPPMDPFG